MRYRKVDDVYVLRIEQGELVHATVHEFCNEHVISNALISGIGAVEWLRCGFYDLASREYLFAEYEEGLEVVSYQGNVMRKEATIFVHAHGSFSDRENNLRGGHVDEMRVGVVMEVFLQPISSRIERTFDEGTGLFLMDL